MRTLTAGFPAARFAVLATFVLASSIACSKQAEPQPSPSAAPPPVAPTPTPAPAAQPPAATPEPQAASAQAAPAAPASAATKTPAAPAAAAPVPAATVPRGAAPAATGELNKEAPHAEEKAAPTAAPTPSAKPEETKTAEAPAPTKETAAPAAKGSALLARAKAGPPDPKTIRTWNAKCSSCHGEDGRGKTTQGEKVGVGDMTSAGYWNNLDDARLRKVVSEGFKREKDGKTQEMRAFGDKLTPDEIDALLAMALSFRP